jgi:hypothetical protein
VVVETKLIASKTQTSFSRPILGRISESKAYFYSKNLGLFGNIFSLFNISCFVCSIKKKNFEDLTSNRTSEAAAGPSSNSKASKDAKFEGLSNEPVLVAWRFIFIFRKNNEKLTSI